MQPINTKQPFISVILPTYNHGKFIAKAIESVLGQTYKNLELIIIDNYSEDDTENIVTLYRNSKVKYLKFRNDGIIAASRNHGIEYSRGDYIAFLDSDDVWHKQKLEKQLIHFASSDIVGVASDAILIPETKYYRQRIFGKSKLGYVDYQYKDILNNNPIFTSSCIVKRKVLERTGFFSEDKDLFCIEDWELWLRMARQGLFRVLEEPLLFYLVSRKRGEQSAIISKNCLKVIEKQVNLGYVNHDDILEPKVSVYLAIARNLLEFDQRQSREYYIKALKGTFNTCRGIKSCTGVLITFLPLRLRKIILLILYKTDWIFCDLKECLWKTQKFLLNFERK